MGRLSGHHEMVNDQGEGKCSVPMFMMGGPAGFCDKPAYGKRPPCRTFYNYCANREQRLDNKYDGYVPALACPGHGGPSVRTFMDGDKWCAVNPDFINLQESPVGFGNTQQDAMKDLATPRPESR